MTKAITVTVRGSQGSGKTSLLRLLNAALTRGFPVYGNIKEVQNDAAAETAIVLLDDPVKLAQAVSHIPYLEKERHTAMCKTCGQTFPAPMKHDCPGLQPRELKDDPAFRAGRELLIEAGERAIDMIESGHFYEDHDASTEALGDLRDMLAVVKDTLRG